MELFTSLMLAVSKLMTNWEIRSHSESQRDTATKTRWTPYGKYNTKVICSTFYHETNILTNTISVWGIWIRECLTLFISPKVFLLIQLSHCRHHLVIYCCNIILMSLPVLHWMSVLIKTSHKRPNIEPHRHRLTQNANVKIKPSFTVSAVKIGGMTTGNRTI